MRLILLIGVAALLFMTPRKTVSGWKSAKNAEKYLVLLHNAEIKHGLPPDLLARVAYQESRFRDDIVNGKVTSAAGAQGIMQIVPRWHPTINPLDVPAAIDYAARYLRQLYQQFGLWSLALAAYNYGPGNVSKVPRDQWPVETRNYVADITGDLIAGAADHHLNRSIYA